jgi:DNA mismatch repair protein MutS
VAQLAGVPRAVNDRARQVLEWLEAQHESSDRAGQRIAAAAALPHPGPAKNGHAHRGSRWQMTLFGLEDHPLLEEIRAAKLDELRPIDALELVRTWQERLADELTLPRK